VSVAADNFVVIGEYFPPGKTCWPSMAEAKPFDGQQFGDGLLAGTN
jgi:hypothetical protein